MQLGFYRLSSVVFAALKAILQKDPRPYWVVFASDSHSRTKDSSVEISLMETTHKDNGPAIASRSWLLQAFSKPDREMAFGALWQRFNWC